MHHTPALVRMGLLLPLAGGMVLAGAAAVAVSTERTDWALAGTILLAALVQTEVTRRAHPARRHESAPRLATAMTSVWSLVAAIAVHLTLAVAVILVLYAYLYLREKRDNDRRHTFARDAGTIVCSLVAAHFVASSGAWATASPQASTGGVLVVAAAGVAHLTVNYALGAVAGLLRHRRVFFGRAADIGLDAALLTVGAITGALAAEALLAVLIAVPVVVTLHNAALTEQLEDDASLDKKTGLATAASWQADADRVFADAAQDRRPIGVLMVDLDHFKRLNDTYGHRAGDDVLAAVGACLRSHLRQSDLGGRFGGEEFTVLLPGVNIIDTMTTAERIRAAISTLHVTTVDKHGRHTVVTDVTASIGAATYPHHGTTAQDCLRVADSHLYQAKQQGRNTVVGIDTENLAPYPAFDAERGPSTRDTRRPQPHTG